MLFRSPREVRVRVVWDKPCAFSPECYVLCRSQIGETTEALNRVEGGLTSVQDSNYQASNQLSGLERQARELNLTSQKLHAHLDILKNSNFLGEPTSLPVSPHTLSPPLPTITSPPSRCLRQHPHLPQQVSRRRAQSQPINHHLAQHRQPISRHSAAGRAPHLS